MAKRKREQPHAERSAVCASQDDGRALERVAVAMRTRAEHIAWCKERAHEYVRQGDLVNAVASMASDMDQHPETASTATGAIATLTVMAGLQAAQGDHEAVIRYIDGFN